MPCGLSIEEKSPSRCLALLWSAVVCLGTFILFYWIWHRSIRPYYFPFTDDLSLIVNSTSPFHPRWTSWFLDGFKNYFDVYTESFVPYTNFIRPTVNLTYFLDYLAFGSNWSMYLLTTYGFVSIIAGTTSFIAYYFLRLGWRLILLTVICTVFAPSLTTAAFYYPSDGFDLLAGALVLLGVCALMSDAVVTAWIIFTIAAFTKETALFAPCFAAAIVFIRKDGKPLFWRGLWSASFLFPVCAWIALYWHDFRNKNGIYVLSLYSSTTTIAHKIITTIKGFALWPIAAVNKTEYWHSSHVLLKVIFVLSLTFNMVTWLILLGGLIYIVRLRNGRINGLWQDIQESIRTSPISIIAIFCIGSLLIPLALGLPNRFGGIFYPLFALCLAFMARRGKYMFVRTYSILMIAAIGIVGPTLIYADIAYYLPTFQGVWAMSKDYMDVLSKSKSPRVFVFDDVSGGYAATENVRRFSGYKGNIVRLNDLLWNFMCPESARIAIEKNLNGDLNLDSKVLRKCGEHDFNGLLLYDLSTPQFVVFERKIAGVVLKYRLVSHSDIQDSSLDSSDLHIVMHDNEPDDVIVIPNLETRRYKEIKIDGKVDIRN